MLVLLVAVLVYSAVESKQEIIISKRNWVKCLWLHLTLLVFDNIKIIIKDNCKKENLKIGYNSKGGKRTD